MEPLVNEIISILGSQERIHRLLIRLGRGSDKRQLRRLQRQRENTVALFSAGIVIVVLRLDL